MYISAVTELFVVQRNVWFPPGYLILHLLRICATSSKTLKGHINNISKDNDRVDSQEWKQIQSILFDLIKKSEGSRVVKREREYIAPFMEREGSSLRIRPISHRDNVILSILLPQPSLGLRRLSDVIIRAIYALRRHQLNLEKVLRFLHSAQRCRIDPQEGACALPTGFRRHDLLQWWRRRIRALHFMKEVARILNTHHLAKAWNSSDDGKFVFIILHSNELFFFFFRAAGRLYIDPSPPPWSSNTHCHYLGITPLCLQVGITCFTSSFTPYCARARKSRTVCILLRSIRSQQGALK